MKISKSTWLKAIAVIISTLLLVGCSVPESTDTSEMDQPLFISKEDSKKNLGFNDFVGSISIYNDDGELYFTFAGLIEDLFYGESYVTFRFEGNTYTYINYNTEIIR